MSDWRKQEDDSWPVQFPTDAPPDESSGAYRERTPPRWTESASVDARAVQKRLAWLLLVAEIGMAVVAACVLPLAFLDLPIQEKGFLGAIGTKVGEWLGVSSQMACLVMVLPIPILMVTLGINWWWFRRMRKKANRTDDRNSV